MKLNCKVREILETVTYNKSNYVDQSVERVQSNEPIVAQDERVQSVGAKRGKVAEGSVSCTRNRS